jgi:hypothetical protein
MTTRDLYTVIMRDSGHPVLPVDTNEHDDQGLLVYLSREAAESAAEHQAELYDLDCMAQRLDKVLERLERHGKVE